MRLARFDACFVLSPRPRGFIEPGPLQISNRSIFEHFRIEMLDFFIQDRLYLLQPEDTLT